MMYIVCRLNSIYDDNINEFLTWDKPIQSISYATFLANAQSKQVNDLIQIINICVYVTNVLLGWSFCETDNCLSLKANFGQFQFCASQSGNCPCLLCQFMSVKNLSKGKFVHAELVASQTLRQGSVVFYLICRHLPAWSFEINLGDYKNRSVLKRLTRSL